MASWQTSLLISPNNPRGNGNPREVSNSPRGDGEQSSEIREMCNSALVAPGKIVY